MSKQSPNIQKLLHRCAKKDSKAQMELFKLYGPTMKAVCRRYLYQQNELSAVLNAAFLRVFENIETYRFEGSFEGWIRKIVVRQCLNENQKKRPVWQSLEESGPLYTEPVEMEAGNMKDIQKAIAALPEGFRIIFNLFEIEGYSHAEIGQELGISESTSRSQLARAKKLLREKLKHLAA